MTFYAIKFVDTNRDTNKIAGSGKRGVFGHIQSMWLRLA